MKKVNLIKKELIKELSEKLYSDVSDLLESANNIEYTYQVPLDTDSNIYPYIEVDITFNADIVLNVIKSVSNQDEVERTQNIGITDIHCWVGSGDPVDIDFNDDEIKEIENYINN